MERDRRYFAAASALSGLLLLAAPDARAQEGWGTTPDLLSGIASTGGQIYAPHVDVDAAGNAVALWTDQGPTIFGTGPVVNTARFDVTTGRRSTPLTLSNRERSAWAVDVVADAAGNALAVWVTNPVSTLFIGHVARYDAATQQWAPVVLVPDSFVQSMAVAVNANGRSVVCWSTYGAPSGVNCQRYAPATGWAQAETISSSIFLEDVAIDAAGNVLVLWQSGTTLQARRFDAMAVSWGAVIDLATGLSSNGPVGAKLAMNDNGEAVATWSTAYTLDAARYLPGSGWTAAVTLNAFGSNTGARPAIDPSGRITVAWLNTFPADPFFPPPLILVARLANGAWGTPEELPGQWGGYALGSPTIDVDHDGNVLVAWSRGYRGLLSRLYAARFAISTSQWTTDADLSPLSQSTYDPDVAFDGSGNAVAVWFQSANGLSVPLSLRWRATPAAPAIAGVAPGPGTLSVDVLLPSSVDPALAPTNLEYSLDGGTTWTPRSPASAASPLDITGLTDGVTYTLALRSVNPAGVGTASAPVQAHSGTASGPTDLRVVSRTGRTVTLAWVAPAAGLVPTDYLIEGGLAGSSQVLASVPTGGAATQVTFDAPDGAFFVRVVGMAGPIRLAASASIQITVNTTAVPAAPVNLLGNASGGVLDLSWTNNWSDAPPTGIRLSVSGALTASVDLPVGEFFHGAGVPAGTYTFTVSALNGAAVSPPSAPVTLTFPGACTTPPLPPAAFSASTQNGRLYVDWVPPAAGPAVMEYSVFASTPTPIAFHTAQRSLAVPVPPGTYTLAVASVGPCGTSAVTPAQIVIVP
ncbi:MAG: hypothetical protein AB7O28_04290 [Vicinamibacterales bacterium]